MGENARNVVIKDHSWVARGRDTQAVLLHVLDMDA
jgi:hypothetical protein